MEFCPKCGAILVQKRKNDGCPRCNYSAKGRTKIKTSEEMEEKPGQMGVLDEKDAEVLPVVSAECKKCKNDKAFFWSVQQRASDEAEVRFFRCTKCRFVWREYR
ncbi:MAG: transcription factor S [Candidatus Pacearchaeota archaeon]|jgi:DNA-directed RNA polymerase subunit M